MTTPVVYYKGMYSNILGERIEALRHDQNLDRPTLGKACGVSQQAVWNWERGDSAPSRKVLVLLADALKVSVDELIRDAGQPEVTS